VRSILVLSIGLVALLGASVAARALGGPQHAPPSVLGSHSNCAGHERWKIKTLVDDQAGSVNTTAKTTTVDVLRENDTRPEKVSAKVGRISPVEFRRYRVHATLREAFREGDGDLHVVIADPHHDGEFDPEHTMIIEFPDASCEPQNGSTYVDAMGNARSAFIALVRRCIGYTGNFGSQVHLSLHATVTGVGFWDLKHGTAQEGRAPNDLELHPVLKLTQATCS
jgi:hypothetical protein